MAKTGRDGAARDHGALTVLASVALPGLWLDPFGPLLKNFTVLAAILAFLAIED